MTSLLFAITLSSLLSVASFLVVIFRVSPIISPEYALPAFFLSLLLAVSSTGTLLLYFFWRLMPVHAWDLGQLIGISLRQGIFLGIATIIMVIFHLLGLLTWWIVPMIYGVFVLVELALNS